MRRSSRLSLLTLVMVLFAMVGPAPADQLKTFNVNNGQNVSVEICDGQAGSVGGYGQISYNGSDHFAAGETATFTVTPGAAATAQGITADVPGDFTIPTPWQNKAPSPTAGFTLNVPGDVVLGTYSIAASASNGTYTVTDSFNLHVRCSTSTSEEGGNTAPEITDIDVDPDSACSVDVTVSFTDDDEDDTHTATVDWGDDTDEEDLDLVGSVFVGSHTYTSAGTFDITATVSDGTDEDSDTAEFSTMNEASGFLPPIPNGSNGHFKAGSTIPVKFTVSDCGGDDVDSLAPNLVLSGGVTASSQANTGTVFRWSEGSDGEGGQYIYNLNTKRSSMAAGSYTLSVDFHEDDNVFGDGPAAPITLKK